MTTLVQDLLDSIISGRATDIESSFKSAISDKVLDLVTDMKTEMAQGIFKESLEEELTLEDYSIEEIEEFMASEEFEQLDELSTNLVGKYLDSALYKSSTIRHGDGTVTEPTPNTPQRKAGKNLAAGKLGWTADGATAKIKAVPSWKIAFDKAQAKKKLTKEEVEPLDEISDKLATNYTAKSQVAYNDPKTSSEKKGKRRAGLINAYLKSKGKANVPSTYESYELDDYTLEELEDYMVSEEFEQLDELSKATLKSYQAKASAVRNQKINNTPHSERETEYDADWFPYDYPKDPKAKAWVKKREKGEDMAWAKSQKHSAVKIKATD